MSREILLNAFADLGALATEGGVAIEIFLYGGALMMLAYDARIATKDVDAVVCPRETGLRLAARVAKARGLPLNWLNDDVRTFLAPNEQLRDLPLTFEGLQLTAPTAGYLLAMKALACRPTLPGYERDLGDLRFLIRKMNIRSASGISEILSWSGRAAYLVEKPSSTPDVKNQRSSALSAVTNSISIRFRAPSPGKVEAWKLAHPENAAKIEAHCNPVPGE